MSLNELSKNIAELNPCVNIHPVSPRELTIKPDSNKKSYITVRDNFDSNFKVKSYTIQVFLYSRNGFEARNYFEPVVKRKISTALAYINHYCDYIITNNCWK